MVIQTDEEYPPLLRQIYDPPLVLYSKAPCREGQESVAMVGSRMTTHYGIGVARKLAYQLAYLGVTVVSGGARGIDSQPTRERLSAKGRTVVRARHWDQHGFPAGKRRTLRTDRRRMAR